MTGMSTVSASAFSSAEHLPPVELRQDHVQDDGRRLQAMRPAPGPRCRSSPSRRRTRHREGGSTAGRAPAGRLRRPARWLGRRPGRSRHLVWVRRPTALSGRPVARGRMTVKRLPRPTSESELDPAAVALDELPRQREPEPRALLPRRVVAPALLERLEDPEPVLRRDARPAVLDGESHLALEPRPGTPAHGRRRA